MKLIHSGLSDKGTFKTYGTEALGYHPSEFKYNETILFENPSELGTGKVKHFRASTLGHNRGFIPKREPDTFYALEPYQSDALQSKRKFPSEMSPEELQIHKKRIDIFEENMKKETLNTRIYEKAKKDVEYLKGLEVGDIQKTAMRKFQTERLFQETLRAAKNQGASKVRVPTPETLIKSQKYPTKPIYEFPKTPEFKSELNLLETNKRALHEKKLGLADKINEEFNILKKGNPFERDLNSYASAFNLRGDLKSILKTHKKGTKDYKLTKQNIEILDELLEKVQNSNSFKEYQNTLDKNSKAITELEKFKEPYKVKEELVDAKKHSSIVKRYAEAPKKIEKQFGLKPKLVKDTKGNTWYEYDVPEDMERIAFSPESSISKRKQQFADLKEHYNTIKNELPEAERVKWEEELQNMSRSIAGLHPDFNSMKSYIDNAYAFAGNYAEAGLSKTNLAKARKLGGKMTRANQRLAEELKKNSDKFKIVVDNSIEGDAVTHKIPIGKDDYRYVIKIKPGLSREELSKAVMHEMKEAKTGFNIGSNKIVKDIGDITVQSKEEVVKNFKKLFPNMDTKQLMKDYNHFFKYGNVKPTEFNAVFGTDLRNELVKQGFMKSPDSNITVDMLTKLYMKARKNPELINKSSFLRRMAFFKDGLTNRKKFVNIVNKLMYGTAAGVAVNKVK